jgi:hypothetical protein
MTEEVKKLHIEITLLPYGEGNPPSGGRYSSFGSSFSLLLESSLSLSELLSVCEICIMKNCGAKMIYL